MPAPDPRRSPATSPRSTRLAADRDDIAARWAGRGERPSAGD
jgi:hypothetical protein